MVIAHAHFPKYRNHELSMSLRIFFFVFLIFLIFCKGTRNRFQSTNSTSSKYFFGFLTFFLNEVIGQAFNFFGFFHFVLFFVKEPRTALSITDIYTYICSSVLLFVLLLFFWRAWSCLVLSTWSSTLYFFNFIIFFRCRQFLWRLHGIVWPFFLFGAFLRNRHW